MVREEVDGNRREVAVTAALPSRFSHVPFGDRSGFLQLRRCVTWAWTNAESTSQTQGQGHGGSEQDFLPSLSRGCARDWACLDVSQDQLGYHVVTSTLSLGRHLNGVFVAFTRSLQWVPLCYVIMNRVCVLKGYLGSSVKGKEVHCKGGRQVEASGRNN